MRDGGLWSVTWVTLLSQRPEEAAMTTPWSARGPAGSRPVARRAAEAGHPARQLALGRPPADGGRARRAGRREGRVQGRLARGPGWSRVPGTQCAAVPAEHPRPQVLETPDVEATRIELKRLVVDINRHMQRLNDIAYDEVEMEIGGSE